MRFTQLNYKEWAKCAGIFTQGANVIYDKHYDKYAVEELLKEHYGTQYTRNPQSNCIGSLYLWLHRKTRV